MDPKADFLHLLMYSLLKNQEHRRPYSMLGCLCLGMVAISPAAASHQPRVPTPAPFKIFYQMSWADGVTAKAPTLQQLQACGLEHVPLVTEPVIFGEAMPRYNQPLNLDAPQLKTAARRIVEVTPPSKLVVLNVEKQGWMIKYGDPYAAIKADK
jgi:hypothetical protein